MNAIHFRVLAAIAMHDRMSSARGKGAGCWASNKTLAQMANVNYTNLSTALHELGNWDYVVKEINPLRKSQHVYRINYDSLPTGKVPSREQGLGSLPMGKDARTEQTAVGQIYSCAPSKTNTPPNNLPTGEGISQSVCPTEKNTQEFQRTNPTEYILLSGKDIPFKRETYSPEGAPSLRVGDGLWKRGCFNPGAMLAITERALADGGVLDQATEQAIEAIAEGAETNSAIYLQANRILETWGAAYV